MSDDHDIFTARGITPPWERGGRVAREQGFERYEGADWRERREVLARMPGAKIFGHDDPPAPSTSYARPERPWWVDDDDEGSPGMTPGGWTTWLRGALAVDGWALPRHATMPDHEDSDLRYRPDTQIRPDVPVLGRWKPPHRHAELRGDARGREQASPRTMHAAKLCDLAPPGHPQAIEHPAGAFLPTGHLHPRTGEVVVPPDGVHRHWQQAKYLYTPGEGARRLGAHPSSVETGYGAADLFVVVLEGTLKMCAVTEAGYPCIDAGSVTLWQSEGLDEGGFYLELESFASRYLRGRRVAVVCDSDWYANRLVLNQTSKVTDILRSRGVYAVACAPPEGEKLDWRHPWTGVQMRAKRGVDDWLGEHPRRARHRAMLDLVVREHSGEQAPGLARFVADAARRADHAESLLKTYDAFGQRQTSTGSSRSGSSVSST